MPKITVDSSEYHIDWSKVAIHSKANKIAKQAPEQNLGSCACCNRKLGQMPKCTLLEDVQSKYSQYGPNVVFYFSIIKRILVLLILSTMIFTVWALWSNFNGQFCYNNPQNCQFQHTVYLWSIYNIIDNQDTLFVQLMLWIGISILVLIFNLYLRRYFIKNYERINNINITDADFSIIIRRLPPDTQISDLYQLIGDMIEDTSPKDLEYADLLTIRDVIMVSKMNQIITAQNQSKKQLKKSIKKKDVQGFVKVEIPKDKVFAGTAIIRFNSIHANQILQIKTPLIERVIRYFFPFVNPRTKYKVKNKRVAIQQAPQPTDIIWSHFGYTQSERIKRKILFTLLSIFVLCFSCGVLYGLSKANDIITDQQGNVPIYFSILMTLFPFIFNHIIGMVLISATMRHRLDNKTEQYIEQMQKIVLYKSINLGFFSLFLPFIVKLPNLEDGVESLSLPYVTFISSITQSFISPTISFFLTYFGVYPKIWKFIMRKGFLLMNQTEVNAMFQGPHIQFANNYTNMIMTVWFAFFFSVVSPICLPINALGLILYYIYQKILLNRRYVIPQYGGSRLNSEFVDILDAAPLLISLFNIFLHYIAGDLLKRQISSNINIALFTNLGISFFIYFIPWGQMIDGCNIKIRSDSHLSYDENQDMIQITYQDLNPFDQNRDKIYNIDRRWGNRSRFQQMLKNKAKNIIPTQRNFFSDANTYKNNDNLSQNDDIKTKRQSKQTLRLKRYDLQ